MGTHDNLEIHVGDFFGLRVSDGTMHLILFRSFGKFLPTALLNRILFAAVLWASLASVGRAEPVEFSIPAQRAPSALQQFIKQSGREVLFPVAELREVQVNAVAGSYEAEEALRVLLKDTGFSATAREAGKFVVVRDQNERGALRGTVVKPDLGSSAGIRILLRETGQQAVTDRRGNFSLANVEAGTYTLIATAEGLQPMHITDVRVRAGRELVLSRETMRAARDVTELEPFVVRGRADEVTELDKYVVEGRRQKAFTTPNIDLTRTRDDALPYTTFSARDVESSGAVNLEEFFRSRLPQNFSSEMPEEFFGSLSPSNSYANKVDMRGWGTEEVVILLNGRRMPAHFLATNGDGNSAQPDFRSIPLGFIERIEVLSSAAGAMYGASATGGVINIITRQDLRGGQVTYNFDTTWNDSSPKRSIDFVYGLPISRKTSLRVAGGYSTSRPLLVGDRWDVSTGRWREIAMEREPSRISSRTAYPELAGTPNIRTVTTTLDAQLFGPGTANFTSVPAGYTGGQGLAPFLDRQGIYAIDISEGNSSSLSRYGTMGVNSRATTLSAGLDHAFTPEWRLSLDYKRSRTDYKGNSGGSTAALPTVPANAVHNPFGQAVMVYFEDFRLERPELEKERYTLTNDASISLRGSIGEWRVILDATYSDQYYNSQERFYHSPVEGWDAAFISGAYNPFVDMRVVAPASAAFYENYIYQDYDIKSSTENYQGTAKASGPLLELGGEPVQMTVGLDWARNNRPVSYQRGQLINSSTKQVVNPRYNWSESPSYIFSTDTYAAYGEITAPVIAPRRNLPFVHKLELFSSGRISEQSRDGRRTNGVPFVYRTRPYLHAIGLRYDVIQGVALRASKSIGFKPPTIGQLTPGNPPTTNQTIMDPKRNNESLLLTPTMRISGGHPDTKPETTDSRNIGVILQPAFLHGFRLSVDYVESVREDVITGISTQNVLDLEDELPGRVQRAAPLPGEPNGVGAVTFVDARNANFREMSSKSVDIALEQSWQNVFGGRLMFNLAATKNISFKVQTTNTTPAVEQVGNPTAAFSRQIAWNGNAQVRWEGRRWSAGWSMRYFDEVLANPTQYVLQGSDRAEWALNHDVFVGYRTGEIERKDLVGLALSNVSITLGVKNAFDREPRFWAATTSGYVSYDSLLGRTVWLQLRKSF